MGMFKAMTFFLPNLGNIRLRREDPHDLFFLLNLSSQIWALIFEKMKELKTIRSKIHLLLKTIRSKIHLLKLSKAVEREVK